MLFILRTRLRRFPIIGLPHRPCPLDANMNQNEPGDDFLLRPRDRRYTDIFPMNGEKHKLHVHVPVFYNISK